MMETVLKKTPTPEAEDTALRSTPTLGKNVQRSARKSPSARTGHGTIRGRDFTTGDASSWRDSEIKSLIPMLYLETRNVSDRS
jgi:hypothetical protein